MIVTDEVTALVRELADEFEITRALDIVEAMEAPNWGRDHPTHNWRNYIPECVAERWDALPLETLAVCVAVGMDRASQEEWD